LIVMVFTGGRTGMQNHGNPGYLNEPPPLGWPLHGLLTRGKGRSASLIVWWTVVAAVDRVVDHGPQVYSGPKPRVTSWFDLDRLLEIRRPWTQKSDVRRRGSDRWRRPAEPGAELTRARSISSSGARFLAQFRPTRYWEAHEPIKGVWEAARATTTALHGRRRTADLGTWWWRC
jgi:hypothetical protein